MRKLYLALFAVLACLASSAKTTTATSSLSTLWSDPSSWDNGIPGINDIIIIPAKTTSGTPITITVDNVISLSGVKLDVYGTLILSGNNIDMTLTTSTLSVYVGGQIQRTKTNSDLMVNGNPIFTGTSLTYNGTTVLPVKFTGFSVARQNSDVLVQWSTAEEVNALSFEVERSIDGSNWNRIATVQAKGNTSNLTNYSYSDKNVTAAVAYYRIRQVDIDGQFLYTTVQAVKSAAGATDIKVAAIDNRVVLQFSNPVKGDVEVRLVTLSGQVVSKQVLHQPVGQVVLNTGSVKGNYIISISNAQEINVAKQVVL